MSYEETKKLINNIVKNEFEHVQDQNLEGMDELKTYEKNSEEISKLQDALLEVLPKEYQYLVDELDSKMWDNAFIENSHYYKKGVAAGTSNLNFLRDITDGNTFY